MSRNPVVAGSFYPGDKNSLLMEIRRHIDPGAKRSSAMGIVSPHAGFMYSGDVAGAVYSRVDIPDTVVLIGPNHTGLGERVSVMVKGVWSMPMGAVEIDTELAQAICEASSHIHADDRAHQSEHSLETQIPFLQYFKKKFRIVPLCLMRLSLDECVAVAKALTAAIERVERPVLIIASSDMTHYESHENARQKDQKAIDQILNMDARGLYETVRCNAISMCGVNPVVVMLMSAIGLGAKQSELVKYMTSGETSGDMDRVVGYAGMIVK